MSEDFWGIFWNGTCTQPKTEIEIQVGTKTEIEIQVGTKTEIEIQVGTKTEIEIQVSILGVGFVCGWL